MADGSIRIETKIDNSNLDGDISELKNISDEAAKSIESNSKNLEQTINKANRELEKTQNELREIEAEIAKIQASTDRDLELAATDDQAATLLEMEAMQTENLRRKQEELNAKIKEQKKIIDTAKDAQKSLNAEVDKSKDKVKKAGNEAATAGKKGVTAAKDVTKHTNNFGKSISDGIKKLGKMALAMFGVHAAYSFMQKAANAYLKDNEQISQQIDAMWSVAGQAIGPVIEKIVEWLSIAVAYANAFIKSLTGIDLIAKANAAALKKQAQATGDAAKTSQQLAGFDEINKLSDPSASASTTQATLFKVSVDTSAVDKALDWTRKKIFNLKEYIKKYYQPSLEAWAPAFENVKNAVSNAATGISDSWTRLKENSLKPISEYILTEWIPSIVNSTNETFAPMFGDVMTVLIDEFARDFEWMCLQIQHYVSDILTPSLQLIQSVWEGICSGIKTAWDEYGQSILDKWVEFRDGIKATWDYIYENILKPIIDFFFESIKELWDNHLKPLWDKLVSFFMSLQEMVLTVWNNFLKPIVDWIISVLAPIIVNVVNSIIQVVKTAFGIIADVIGGIFEFLGGLCDFITGIFSGDIKKALNGLIKMVNGLKNAVWGVIKGLINLIIDGLNFLWTTIYSAIAGIVNGIGSIAKAIGELIGANWGWEMPKDPPKIPKFTWDIPDVPLLALGGIVNNPGRGVPVIAGEAGAEAVLPLERNTEWMDILAEKISGSGQLTIPIILSGKKIAEYVVDLQKKKAFAMNGG